MSNLNMPNMRFANIVSTLMGKRNNRGTIAYATTAVYYPQDGNTDAYVAVMHHGTVIAEIAADWVFVRNAGYGSSTTRQRINKVLSDNYVPHYVAQRNFAQCLFESNTHTLVTDSFHEMMYDHNGSGIRWAD